VNADYSVSPGLATVKRVDDTTYNVTINSAATFWDGNPVTADDAIWSIQRYFDKKLGSVYTGEVGGIKALTKTGDRTFTITLSAPDATFYNLLASPVGVVMEKAYSEAEGSKLGTPDGGLMCSGPYQLTSWSKGNNLVLTANPHYWNTSSRVLTQKATFTFNTDAASANAAMKRGEIDGEFNFSASSIASLKNTSGTLTLGPSVGFNALNFINVASGPLNVDQRHALSYAIDYNGIINGVWKSAATEQRTLSPRSAYTYSKPIFDAAWNKLTAGQHDLAKAKALMKKAGKPKRAVVFAYSTDLPEFAQIAAAVQSAAESIGIKMTLKPLTASQYSPIYFDPSARKGIDLMFFNGYLDLPPQPLAWDRYYKSQGGAFNFSGASNKTFDSNIDKAVQTFDQNAQAELMVKAEKSIDSQAVVLPICEPYTRTWVGKGLTGVPTSGVNAYMPWLAQLGSTN